MSVQSSAKYATAAMLQYAGWLAAFLLLIIAPLSLVAGCAAPQAPAQPVTPAPNTSQEADPTLPAFTPAGTETQIGFNIKGWV